MVGRVGDVERLGRLGDQADKALADLQPRPVHRARVEALGGEQFVHGAARKVNGADVRNHGRGHHGDEAVQALLRLAAVLHDLPQFAQENARPADIGRSYHRVLSNLLGGARFQTALRGTLQLSRTNAFFLGGGKALMNTYYAAAERLGVAVRYDADVVALQEVPLGGSETPDVLAQLRDVTGMYAVEGPTLDSPKRRYGNAVLSRLPVRATRTLDLSFHRREPRGALDADIECGGQLLRVVATHLGLSASERSTQVRTLLSAFDNSELPVILVGDINEWFVRGRALRALVSHFRCAPAPRTFPTFCPVFALDRIWMHPGECLIDVSVHRSALARQASDHYPLVARIRVPAHRRTSDCSASGS